MNGIRTENRRKKILEKLEKEGHVSTLELAGLYGKSEVTIRNDLRDMEQANLLQRVHGGAVHQRNVNKFRYETSLSERMNINKDEKLRIASACTDLVKDGDIVMMDSGTTTLFIAQELSRRSNLTILTNCILVAQEFFYNLGIKVILLGGDVEPSNQFTYGNSTVTQLLNYRADKYILSVDGISVANGITTVHHQETEVSRHMMDRATKVIAVADHTKIGKEGFSFISELQRIHLLVTDKYDRSKTELEKMKAQGIEIIEV